MPRRRSGGFSPRDKMKSAGRLAARARAAFPPAWLAPFWRPRILLLVGTFVVALGTGLAWGSWRNLCATCPSVARIRTYEPTQTSKLYSHDGVLITELGIEKRTPVALAALPKYVPEAVVAVEDKRFYERGAFDWIGFARALVGKLTFRNRGGGSTISQQLARNMFEEALPAGERRLLGGGGIRKLRELQVAMELEQSYTKDQILEAYMNEIYLGRFGYGFQAAAAAVAGKDAWDMNPAEAALIAAMIQVPATFDPFRHPDNALRRRNLVLELMADQDYLSEEEAERWKKEPIPTQDQVQSGGGGGVAPYFTEWVRQILESRFGSQVYSGGLRVTTTLDVGMQKAAQQAMDYGWERIEGWPTFKHPKYADYDTVKSFPTGETPYLQGALVALEPQTGAVRALIGGRNFRQSKFDRARQARRQAGSSFKPFVYAAAISSGIPASHVIVDAPVMYPQVSGVEWRPQNYEGTFEGPMTLRYALRHSVNMVAIRLGWEEVGIESVAQTAKKLGISTEIERFPSTTIGAVEVIPMDVAESYQAFATIGTRARPFPIERVENAQGEVLWEPQPERTQVLDSAAARLMVDLLQDAANRGTGAQLRQMNFEGGLLPYDVPVGGKTGTTNDATDVWFNGFTPNLVATVWFGFDRPSPITPKATGGIVAAPTWGRFARGVYYGDTATAALKTQTDSITGKKPGAALPIPGPWPMAEGLTTRQVDAKTGKLWSEYCKGEEYTEFYIPGSEPTEQCDDSGRGIFRVPRIPGRGAEGQGIR